MDEDYIDSIMKGEGGDLGKEGEEQGEGDSIFSIDSFKGNVFSFQNDMSSKWADDVDGEEEGEDGDRDDFFRRDDRGSAEEKLERELSQRERLKRFFTESEMGEF